MNAHLIAQQIREGKLTAVAAVEKSLKIIKQKNPEINAFAEVFEQEALSRAKEIDRKKANNEPLGRLAGVPVAIKDNMLYKGHTASCASKMLLNYKAAYTATVVQKLLDEDAVIVGRANMDEFAMGSSNEHSVYGPVKNPVDTTRVPGGSSGGSAAAVASGMVAAALGSDTGGSIRQPASFCGIVGVKPTYGLVSRYGVIAFASSADQVGALTNNVEDAALMLAVLSGYDERDSTSSLELDLDFMDVFTKDLKGIKIGVPTDFFNNLDAEIKNSFDKAVEVLKNLGAEFVDIKLPYAKYSVPCYYIITGAEASSNLARFDGIRYGYSAQAKDLEGFYGKTRTDGFGIEVKRRILIGQYVSSKENYEKFCVKARKVRTLIKRDFKDAFKNVDIILTPTSPTVATKLGGAGLNKANTFLADLYTCPGNMADLPGISVPCGINGEGLPIGLQFYADEFKEDVMLRVSQAYEQAVKKVK